MSEDQKLIIDNKDEAGLKSTISFLMATHHKDKKELIEYCEKRLEALNVGSAMLESSEIKVGEV